jgi:hypothetical protein
LNGGPDTAQVPRAWLETLVTLRHFESAQPVLRTLLTAAAFALSVRLGRPLVARFAQDFCPLDPDVLSRPAISRLFCRLTYQWACVNVALAAVSLALLWTVSTTTFVGATAIATWLITATGVYLTVSDSVRTARSRASPLRSARTAC